MKAHLNYLEGIITKEDILEIKEELSKENIELTSHDESGVIKACFDFGSPITLMISKEIIMSGIGYDLMKLIAIKILSKISNKYFYIIKAGAQEKKSAKLNIRAVSKNGEINLTIDGTLDKEIQKLAIEKSFDYFKAKKFEEDIHFNKRKVIGSFNKETYDLETQTMEELIKSRLREQDTRKLKNKTE